MNFLQEENLFLHHIGCLTENIGISIKTYQNDLGFVSVSKLFNIEAQKVVVCFVETAPNIFIELVQPSIDNKSLQKLLKNKVSFYHIGYLTTNFDVTLENLISKNFYHINTFFSEAFNNKKCAFLYTPEMQLIEIIQK